MSFVLAVFAKTCLTEAEKRDVKENNAVYLSGVMQRCDEKNGNGRIYPGEILRA
jgi:hypothetical protein